MFTCILVYGGCCWETPSVTLYFLKSSFNAGEGEKVTEALIDSI